MGDFSGLDLLSEVATTTAVVSSSDLLAVQVLSDLMIIKKKGLLLSDLQKVGFSVPKKIRSTKNRTDLLSFIVPRFKRSNRTCHRDRDNNNKKRKMTLSSGSGDVEAKRQRTLWSFQRKSEFRFSLIKIPMSSITTAVC